MKKWWKYAVLRGNDLPVSLNGKWFDVSEHIRYPLPSPPGSAVFEATNEWEQREDGEVAVVYRLKEIAK